jgi:hypothetical protein
MQGERWRKLSQSVETFIGNLSDNDLVSAMVFNNKVKLLTKMDF